MFVMDEKTNIVIETIDRYYCLFFQVHNRINNVRSGYN